MHDHSPTLTAPNKINGLCLNISFIINYPRRGGEVGELKGCIYFVSITIS